MAFHEERRRVGLRLSVLQYLIDGAVLGARRRLLGAAGRAARQVPGNGREQPPADARAARAARRAVRPRRPRAGREPPLVQHLDRPRADQGPQSHDPRCSPRCSASTKRSVREIVERHRREPSYRPITIVQDASLAQVAAVTARRLRLRTARRRRRAGADAAVPRHARRASVRLRRRSQRRAGRRGPPTSRAATSSASRASRRSTTRC